MPRSLTPDREPGSRSAGDRPGTRGWCRCGRPTFHDVFGNRKRWLGSEVLVELGKLCLKELDQETEGSLDLKN
ncbi:hypothetical protein MRX96_042200 [Rhipicephalus microplus]